MSGLETEYTLVMIKPDAFERNLVDMIRQEIEIVGFEIIPVGFADFDLDLVCEFYQWEEVKCPSTVKSYLCSNPIPLWIIKGINVIEKMTEIKWRIRRALCSGNHQNLLHCSSTKKKFNWEYGLLRKNDMAIAL